MFTRESWSATCRRTEPSRYCLINPEIFSAEGTTNSEEGCLSVPEFYDYIDRAAKVKVRALDRDGKPFEFEAEGLLAVCIQHEMDHLEGKLFVDYLVGAEARAPEEEGREEGQALRDRRHLRARAEVRPRHLTRGRRPPSP